MSPLPVGAVPPVDQRTMPAAVREGGAEVQDRYRAAASFERVLAQQLAQQLLKTAAPAGDEQDDASAATSAYRDMLPDVFADVLTANGGLGIAAQVAAAASAGARQTGDATASDPDALPAGTGGTSGGVSPTTASTT
jgi:Rod binding domain-containing protein